MNKENFARRFAQSVIIAAMVGVSVLLLYGVIHYNTIAAWTFKFFNSPFDKFFPLFVVYVLPALLLSVLAISLKRSTTVKVNIALGVISTIVSLFLAESGLKFWEERHVKKQQQEFEAFVKKRDKPADWRTKLEIVLQLQEEGERVGTAVVPRSFGHVVPLPIIKGKKVFPLSGLSNAITVFCNETGDWVIYESDEHGFHNPRGLYNPGNLDIAVIGDSFVQGACVPPEKNIVGRIRKTYKSTLNLGYWGNEPLLELATFREYAQPLQPKIVLWVYFSGNDLEGLYDIMMNMKRKVLKSYLNKDYRQNLLALRPDLDEYLIDLLEEKTEEQKEKLKQQKARAEAEKKKWRVFAMLQFRYLRQRFTTIFSPENEESIYAAADVLRHILLVTNNTVGSWGGKLYFVYLPAWSSFTDPFFEKSVYRDEVLSIVKSLNISVIDIYAIFLRQDDPLSMFPFRTMNAHYTEEGYAIVAREILHAIKQDGFSTSSE